eukprot:s305_g14.t1
MNETAFSALESIEVLHNESKQHAPIRAIFKWPRIVQEGPVWIKPAPFVLEHLPKLHGALDEALMNQIATEIWNAEFKPLSENASDDQLWDHINQCAMKTLLKCGATFAKGVHTRAQKPVFKKVTACPGQDLAGSAYTSLSEKLARAYRLVSELRLRLQRPAKKHADLVNTLRLQNKVQNVLQDFPTRWWDESIHCHDDILLFVQKQLHQEIVRVREKEKRSRIKAWRSKMASATASRNVSKLVFKWIRSKTIPRATTLICNKDGDIIAEPDLALDEFNNQWDDVFSANVLHDSPHRILEFVWPYLQELRNPVQLPPVTGEALKKQVLGRKIDAAPGMDGWRTVELVCLPTAIFDLVADFFAQVELNKRSLPFVLTLARQVALNKTSGKDSPLQKRWRDQYESAWVYCHAVKESLDHLIDCPALPLRESMPVCPADVGPNFRMLGLTEVSFEHVASRLKCSQVHEIQVAEWCHRNSSHSMHLWTDGSCFNTEFFWHTVGSFAVIFEGGKVASSGRVYHPQLSSYTCELWAIVSAFALADRPLICHTDCQCIADQTWQMICQRKIQMTWPHIEWWSFFLMLLERRLAFSPNPLVVSWCRAHVLPSIPWFLITEEEAKQHDTTILDIYHNRIADSTAKRVFPADFQNEFGLKCENIAAWQVWLTELCAEISKQNEEQKKSNHQQASCGAMPVAREIPPCQLTIDYDAAAFQRILPKWSWIPHVMEYDWKTQFDISQKLLSRAHISDDVWGKVVTFLSQLQWKQADGLQTAFLELAYMMWFADVRLPDVPETPADYATTIRKCISQSRKYFDVPLVPGEIKAVNKSAGRTLPSGVLQNVEVARLDGIATIVKAMTEQHQRGELQLAGMNALEKMTSGNPIHTRSMVDSNGINAVSNAMSQDLSKADLQATGCKILCNVAKHDAYCQEMVAKSGAAQAVLDAMRAHASDSDIQELGCHALKEFAAFNAESQEDIYMRGGIQAVLRAMETFPQLPNLQVMGCGVLRNLAACNSQQQQAVVSRGGIQVVLDSMSAHKEHSLMQWAGCWTLFCLCVHNAEMRSEVYAYGAARAALKALEAHRLEARVQEAGCWLLKELAEHMAGCKDRATFSAAIQAALKAVEKYPGNQAVEKAARTALQKLSAFDKEGWVKMACLGRCGRLGRTATMRTLEAIQE